MTPPGQLIWRNHHRLNKEEPLLLVALPADDLAARLTVEGFGPQALCLSCAAQERMEAAGVKSTFGLATPDAAPYTAPYATIVLFQPRERALLDMLLEFCGSLMDPAGELWLVGENRAGIKSADKRLGDHFARSAKLDSARHCTLFSARVPKANRTFCLDDHVEAWPLESAGRSLTVSSLPGVFAHGRLDAGTRLLLRALTGPGREISISGRVLDFACGSGAIGLALAAAFPDAELTLLDDSALALESARRTFDVNGIEARLVASNGLSGLLRSGEALFDWIVSNPPFHAGVRQETGIARKFLSDCPRLLRPRGRLCLVANAHLPYGRWLAELFDHVQVLAAGPGYNIWLALGPIKANKTRTS